MKSLGESVVHHIKYYIQLLNDDGNKKNIKPLKHKLPVHRMAVVNLGTFLMQFLESLVPLEMVRTVLHPSVHPDLSYGSFCSCSYLSQHESIVLNSLSPEMEKTNKFN